MFDKITVDEIENGYIVEDSGGTKTFVKTKKEVLKTVADLLR